MAGQLGLMQSKVHSLAEMTKCALDSQEKVKNESRKDMEELGVRRAKFQRTVESMTKGSVGVEDLLPVRDV